MVAGGYREPLSCTWGCLKCNRYVSHTEKDEGKALDTYHNTLGVFP